MKGRKRIEGIGIVIFLPSEITECPGGFGDILNPEVDEVGYSDGKNAGELSYIYDSKEGFR
jgi:hypothetical protein